VTPVRFGIDIDDTITSTTATFAALPQAAIACAAHRLTRQPLSPSSGLPYLSAYQIRDGPFVALCL
jgi:hypothetical protein